MSAEKPKALALPPSPLPPGTPRQTALGRAAITQTLVGHASAAPPEVTAWLNALLKLDGKPATPLGEAMNVAHAAPTVPAFAAVTDADVPELPASALQEEEKPREPAPLEARAPATPPPVPLVAEAPAPPPPLPPVAVEPVAVAAPAYDDDAPPPPVRVSPATPPETSAAAHDDEVQSDDDDAAVVAGSGRPKMIALAIVVGGLALAATLVLRGRPAPAPEAPSAPPPVAAEAPTPRPAPAPAEEKPLLEIALDPSHGEAAAPPPAAEDAQPAAEAPRPARRERAATATEGGSAVQRGNALLKAENPVGAAAAFQEAARANADDAAAQRGLGLAYEQLGNTEAALAAFKRYLQLATRSRDKEWAARHLYSLAHPE
jgi:hypothetical protein